MSDIIRNDYSTKKWRESKQLLLTTVFIALFMDSMLATTVVPIIPQYLEGVRHLHYTPLNFTKNSNSSYKNEKNIHDSLKYSAEIGILFGSRPLVQLFVNPIVGPITQKIGYAKIKLIGFFVLFLSILLFAIGETYEILFLARSIHGIATSCTLVAGMGALSARYKKQQKRDDAIRLALGGSALGFMVGPPFGAFMYEYYGKTTPFAVLSGISLIEGGLELIMKQPKLNQAQLMKPSLWVLLKDPYIVIAAIGMLLSCAQFTFLETNLILWVMDEMNPEGKILGTIGIPLLLGFIIVLNIFGHWCLKMGRWLMAMLGMIIVALFFLLIPYAKDINSLMIPNLGLGVGIGMAQTAIMPEFAHLVDIRYSAVYGNTFAISDLSRCVGHTLGSMIGGILVKYFTFPVMIRVVAILSLLYSPLMYLLRKPPKKNKKTLQGEKKSDISLIGLTQNPT